MIHDYDYIIAGGGCAGLSLAYHLLRSDLKDHRVLVVDKSLKLQNDKTWCFWTSDTLPYQSAQQTTWREMKFSGSKGELTQPISPLKYYCINSLEFYQEVTTILDDHPNVDRIIASVIHLEDQEEGVIAHTTSGSFSGKWAFNSIIDRPQLEPQHIFLKQHFTGWVIETTRKAFDPDVIHLMDFKIDQKEEVRFMYILPFSEYRALVEFTVFSPDTFSQEAYYKVMHEYLENNLNLDNYWIDSEEFGVIPMTNYPFTKFCSKRITNIGTAGGHTKPSTGYTFLNIQQDSRRIVDSLVTKGTPQYKLTYSNRFKFYDTLLLHIIQNQPGYVKDILSKLFKRNDFRKILKFLDEKTTLREEIWLLGRLPWRPFLQAIYEYYFKKTWKNKTQITQPVKEPQKVEYTV